MGEASEAFTAVVGASARIDAAGNKRVAKIIDEIYAVLPGFELAIDDLLVDNDGRKEIVLLENLSTHLQINKPDCKLQIATTKEEYQSGVKGAIIGNARVLVFKPRELNNEKPASQSTSQASMQDDDDVPF